MSGLPFHSDMGHTCKYLSYSPVLHDAAPLVPEGGEKVILFNFYPFIVTSKILLKSSYHALGVRY
jgi:hypothetical protein